MIFSFSKQKLPFRDDAVWERRFAIFPVCVAEVKDNSSGSVRRDYVLFGFYERRKYLATSGSCVFFEYRALGSDKFFPKRRNF